MSATNSVPAEQTAEAPVVASDAAPKVEELSAATKEETSGGEAQPEASGSAADDKAEVKKQDDDKEDNRIRLNGAARKRFRWLLDQGYDREKASEMAKEPLKIKELRDKLEAETGKKFPQKKKFDFDEAYNSLSEAAKKRLSFYLRNGYSEKQAILLARKLDMAGGLKRGRPDSFNDGPANKQARSAPIPGGILMAVACKEYPAVLLTSEQAGTLKSAILKQVVQQKDAELKPHFEKCILVQGYLQVHCSDAGTRSWLQSVVPKLELWEGASLKVVLEKILLKTDIFIATFADSSSDSDKDILNFVESQNDGINISKWRIITRKEIKKSIELTFTTDPASARKLDKLGYEINYKFNKIKIRKKNKPSEISNKKPVGTTTYPTTERVPPPASRRNLPPRRNFNQPRPSSSSFVPIWDNNMPNRGGNSYKASSPPRRANNSAPYQQRFNRDANPFNRDRNSGNRGRFNPNFRNGGNNGNSNGVSGGFQSNNRSRNFGSLYDQLKTIGNSGKSSNNFDKPRSRPGNSGYGGGNTGGGNFSNRGFSNNRNFFSNSRLGFF